MAPNGARRLPRESEERSVRVIVGRDFSASRMNTTRWAEVAECLKDMPVRCRARFVDVPDREFEMGRFWHVTGDWFDSGSLSTFPSLSIEWLDIIPDGAAAGCADEVASRLASLSVPFHREGEALRIVGHVSRRESL